MGWDTRLAWSGEVPLTWPGLGPVALQRFTSRNGTEFPDAVDPSRVWKAHNITFGSGGDHVAGRWGRQIGFNRVHPATEKGRITLPYFKGLWPSSGKLLVGLWMQHNYTMSFIPFLSTRGGSSPLVYLSGYSAGNVRHGVYSASGAQIGDQPLGTPWGATYGYQWLGQLIDYDARTSQIISVNRDTGQSFISSPLALSGPPAAASPADLDVFDLRTAGYWAGGYVDEVLVAHPDKTFSLSAFVAALAGGTYARGGESTAFTVSDGAVRAIERATLLTGAERVTLSGRVEPSIAAATPYWSTDGGSSWKTGSSVPSGLNGLLRWEVPLAAGDAFTGLDLLPPSPELAAIPAQKMKQRGTLRVPLSASYTGTPRWTVAAPGIDAEVSDSTLTLRPGWASGDIGVTVTLRDDWDRRVSRTFTLRVDPEDWEPAEAPQYPRTPIVVGEGRDTEAIIDASEATVVKEVNGEHSLEFSVPVKHPRAGLLLNETPVELAGELYRIRRVTTSRKKRAPSLEVYCEAKFYDLAYSGQVEAKEYLQAAAGTAMEDALKGTGWTVGAVTVVTRRTYTTESMSPLALLRTIQAQHGGDLLFDGHKQTVSLVSRSGRDAGVAFLYGRGLSESKRVVDTTSLVTRIIPRNADGVGIETVNGGVPWVEDYTYTGEVRSAVYNFQAGASPFTMLAMASATLANRSKPSYSYEFTVADLSHITGQPVDAFDVGDVVTVIDQELDIRESQRVLKVEHDVISPWRTKVTLSGKLRETGGRSADEAGALSTGSTQSTFDLVPYNALKNGRFDNGLAHWAGAGVAIVDGEGTGDYAVRFAGSGSHWIEQTVAPDNRDNYTLSLDVRSSSAGVVPDLRAIVTVHYEDGTSEAIPVELV